MTPPANRRASERGWLSALPCILIWAIVFLCLATGVRAESGSAVTQRTGDTRGWLAGREQVGDKAGSSAAGRTQGHGAEETEGPGRAESSAYSSRSASHRAQQSLARVTRQVFGPRAPVALCIAHYESTDGRFQVNGPNLGPWQVNVDAHPWANAYRLVTDWLYSARVAYRISKGGTDWGAWATHRRCGV